MNPNEREPMGRADAAPQEGTAASPFEWIGEEGRQEPAIRLRKLPPRVAWALRTFPPPTWEDIGVVLARPHAARRLLHLAEILDMLRPGAPANSPGSGPDDPRQTLMQDFNLRISSKMKELGELIAQCAAASGNRKAWSTAQKRLPESWLPDRDHGQPGLFFLAENASSGAAPVVRPAAAAPIPPARKVDQPQTTAAPAPAAGENHAA